MRSRRRVSGGAGGAGLAALVTLVASCRSAPTGGAELPGGEPLEGAPAVPLAPRGTLSVFYENDVFVNSDDKYTSGLGVTWATPAVSGLSQANFWRQLTEAVDFLPTFDRADFENFATMTFGQEMYTPEDITLAEPPPGDQPYAGVLFLDTAVHSKGERSLHSYQLRLGIVGPSSGAEAVQRWVHEQIDADLPQGWDTQLKDEPLLNLDYRYGHRFHVDAFAEDWGYDLTGHAGGGLGNYFIGASAGVDVRAGLRLPDSYGPTTLRNSGRSMVGVTPLQERRWRAYGFLGLSFVAVGRFLPADGNTFRDSPSADRDDFFATASTGVVLQRGGLQLSYLFSGLGEFDSFPEPRSSDFGTLAFTFFF